jgi:hypothetical protein
MEFSQASDLLSIPKRLPRFETSQQFYDKRSKPEPKDQSRRRATNTPHRYVSKQTKWAEEVFVFSKKA